MLFILMIKLKFRIKDTIKKQYSWAKDFAGEIIEINSDNHESLHIGPCPKFGVKMGAYINFEDLELISAYNGVDNIEVCNQTKNPKYMVKWNEEEKDPVALFDKESEAKRFINKLIKRTDVIEESIKFCKLGERYKVKQGFNYTLEKIK